MKNNAWIGLAAMLSLAGCGYENFNERCAREVREYTEKECPRRIDPYTIMDSMTFDATGKELAYYYTLEDSLDSKELMSDELVEDFEQSLCKALSTSVEMKAYKEHNLNFRYTYISKSTGETLVSVVLTPEMYK